MTSPDPSKPQLDRADLARLTTEEITAAHQAGRLAALLAPTPQPPDLDRIAGSGQLHRCDLLAMTSSAIDLARRTGRLTDLGFSPG
jgi:hypothetical protein